MSYSNVANSSGCSEGLIELRPQTRICFGADSMWNARDLEMWSIVNLVGVAGQAKRMVKLAGPIKGQQSPTD
jgi:hypothetical protein